MTFESTPNYVCIYTETIPCSHPVCNWFICNVYANFSSHTDVIARRSLRESVICHLVWLSSKKLRTTLWGSLELYVSPTPNKRMSMTRPTGEMSTKCVQHKTTGHPILKYDHQLYLLVANSNVATCLSWWPASHSTNNLGFWCTSNFLARLYATSAT